MKHNKQEIGRFLYDHVKEFKLIGSYAMVDAQGKNLLRRGCAPDDIDYIVRYNDYPIVQEYVEDTGSTRTRFITTVGDVYDFHLLTNEDYIKWYTATAQMQSVCILANDIKDGVDLTYLLKCKSAFDNVFRSLICA